MHGVGRFAAGLGCALIAFWSSFGTCLDAILAFNEVHINGPNNPRQRPLAPSAAGFILLHNPGHQLAFFAAMAHPHPDRDSFQSPCTSQQYRCLVLPVMLLVTQPV